VDPVNIQTLTLTQAWRFRGLAPGSLRASLEEGELPHDLLLLGLYAGGQPAGLLVGRIAEDAQGAPEAPVACIQSIAVARSSRRQGFATQLLQHFEQSAAHLGASTMRITYVSDGRLPAPVQGLLHKAGWPLLRPSALYCATDFKTLSRAPWMNPDKRAPGFEYCLWSELTPSERQSILARQAKESYFADDLSPFLLEEQMVRSTSVALRYHGEVVGWSILRRIDDATAQCCSLFVEERFQRLGRALMPLARSLQLHGQIAMQNFLFDVKLERPAMVAFVERRMRPYLTALRYVARAEKPVHPSLSSHADSVVDAERRVACG
jgi:GNAT superfamily N-acetyltransferase